MPAVGDLVRSTTGAWIERPPQHCPRRHRLGPRAGASVWGTSLTLFLNSLFALLIVGDD